MKETYYKPECPRCGSKNTRAVEENATIICQHCGYSAHWRQFFEGTKEREEVRKLFFKGELEGNPCIEIKEEQKRWPESSREK